MSPHPFSVDTHSDDPSGVVSLKNSVDYEQYTSYRVTLNVTNDEDLSNSLCESNERRKEHGLICVATNS